MSETGVTKQLAAWTVGLKYKDIPASVRAEGVRTFVNWLGCAVGGAGHETVDRALAVAVPFSGPKRASVIGRSERLDELHAALINGISSHVLDYDDTHLKTIIHPAGPVASAHSGGRRGARPSAARLPRRRSSSASRSSAASAMRLSRPLRSRLAHHRHGRRVRRRGGGRQAARARRAADDLGARHSPRRSRRACAKCSAP